MLAKVAFLLGDVLAVGAAEGDGVEAVLGIDVRFHVPDHLSLVLAVGAAEDLPIRPVVPLQRPVALLADILDAAWKRQWVRSPYGGRG